jgi:hypothetical protein
MPELRDRPVFICGHPKSGTSLLRSLLDGHPELLVYPEETSFFRRYLPKAQGKSLEEKLALADEYLIHIFTWNQDAPPASQAGFPDRDYSDISFEQVRQAMHQMIHEQYRHDGDMLFAALAAFGQVTGCMSDRTLRWVEKTPYNERYVKQILAWWPEARFIHVIRDPRDNFASYQRKHPQWTAESFARSWRDSALDGLNHQEALSTEPSLPSSPISNPRSPAKYWVLRYEDLLQQPEECLRRMCQFLGVQDHPTLRNPTRNGKPWGGNSMFGERFSKIDSSPLGRWRESLAPEEILIIDRIAVETMRRLNYPPSGLNWKAVPPGSYLRLLKALVATNLLSK